MRILLILFVTIMLHFSQLFSQGTRLVYHETQKYSTLDPVTMGNPESVRIVELLFGSLYTFDLDRQIIPEFAEGLPELSANNFSAKVKLKSDLRWSDGSPITIGDIIFSWKAYIDPKSDGNSGALLKRIIRNIKKTSYNTFDVYFNKRVIFPERYLTFFIIPEHSFSSTAIRKHLAYCRKPKVTSGQYMIIKKDPNIHSLEMKLNTKYTLQKPSITNIQQLFYSNKAFLPSLILGGSTDMLTSFNLEHYAELNASDIVKVQSYESNSLPIVIINHDNPLLKEPEIRQALDMAIDRENLLNSLYSGQGNLISGPFPYDSPYNNASVSPTAYAVNKAKRILDSLGYVETGSDGFREKNGQRLTLDFVVFTSDDPTLSALFTNFKKMWENIGIKINMKSYLPNTFNDALRTRKFDLIYYQQKFDISADIYTLYSSEYGGKGQPNFGNFRDPKVDKFLKEALYATDFQTKMGLNKELHKILHDDVANIYLWQIPAYAAYSSKLKNVTIDPFYFFTTIADWKKDESNDDLGEDWFK